MPTTYAHDLFGKKYMQNFLPKFRKLFAEIQTYIELVFMDRIFSSMIC